ncbi:MAG: hypothetical protein ABI627_12770 [Polyangiaceae bacterium]
MLESSSEVRLRYPLRALLLLGFAWCFYACVLLPCALFMLPIIPLAPLFVVIMVSLGGLLASVHEYARSVATPVQRAKVRGARHGQIPQASRCSAQSS